MKRFMANFLIWVLLVFAASGVACAGDYSILDLGMPDGYVRSKAFDINDNGQVVGSLFNGTDYSGFIWDTTNNMQILSGGSGSSWATTINNNGWIAGGWNDVAALWQGSSSTPTSLGTLGGPTSTAFKINDNNQISGYSDLAGLDYWGSYYFHGFLYENGQMKDVGTLTASWPGEDYSFAYGINNNGQIVGVATADSSNNDAFIRNADGAMIDLGLGPDPINSYQASAVAINDAGLVGGHYADLAGSHPLIWNPGSVNGFALTMPNQFPYGEVYGVNEKGAMVGVMWNNNGDPDHAFVYDSIHGVRDLNDLIPAGSGWVLNYAKGINENGQISGYGIFNGQTRGYVLNTTPEPISSMLFLLGGAAFGLRRFRRKKS